jgi:molybdopterin/thiamine biosynthesis adenylyltransferase
MIDPRNSPAPLPDERWVERFSRDPGVSLALRQCHVVIVGVGFVGSQVAWLLAQMGAGYLHLCDPDVLCESNLSRHIADTKYLGENKAIATGRTIADRLPGVVVDIEGVTRDLMDAPAAGVRHFLRDKNALVLATGNPQVDRFINRCAQAAGILTLVPGLMPGRGPLIGDLLISSPQAVAGACVECLRPARDDEPRGAEAQPGLAAEGITLATHTALAVVDGLVAGSRGSERLRQNLDQGRNYLLLARAPVAAAMIKTSRRHGCPACRPRPGPSSPIAAAVTTPAVRNPVTIAATVSGAIFGVVFAMTAMSGNLAGVVVCFVLAAAFAVLFFHISRMRH